MKASKKGHVVKAFGYGSDAIEAAKCLASQGVDYFGVAYVQEALRKTIESHICQLWMH